MRFASTACRAQVQFVVVALLEDISKGIDDSANMPSQDAASEMEDAKAFKERNLATAQRTMDSLLNERKKREKELEMLRTSEPKLMNELSGLREAMSRMRSEMEAFQVIPCVCVFVRVYLFVCVFSSRGYVCTDGRRRRIREWRKHTKCWFDLLYPCTNIAHFKTKHYFLQLLVMIGTVLTPVLLTLCAGPGDYVGDSGLFYFFHAGY